MPDSAMVTAWRERKASSDLLNDLVRLTGTKLAREDGTWHPRHAARHEAKEANYRARKSGLHYTWQSDREILQRERAELRSLPKHWMKRLRQQAESSAQRTLGKYRSSLTVHVELSNFAADCNARFGGPKSVHFVVPTHYRQTERIAHITGLNEKLWLLGSNEIGYDEETNSITYRLFHIEAISVNRNLVLQPRQESFLILEDVDTNPIWAWSRGGSIPKLREAYHNNVAAKFKSLLRAA